MNFMDALARLEAFLKKSIDEQHTHTFSPRQSARGPSKFGIRATSTPGRIVVGSGGIPFWKMRGFHLVNSALPGVQTWRGPLITCYGQVIAEIESPHDGQYSIYIVNLPGHLHGHPCLPKTGRRWEMHVHGVLRNLDHVIFSAERELEHHWNWHG